MIVLFSMFISGLALWFLLYPIKQYSIEFWTGVVLMIIPGLVAAESLGSLGLSADGVKKLPKVIRLIFGVFWVLLCLFIFGSVFGLLSSLVGVQQTGM